jgi:hypothetical protein
VTLVLSGVKLRNVETLSKSDPYLEISRSAQVTWDGSESNTPKPLSKGLANGQQLHWAWYTHWHIGHNVLQMSGFAMLQNCAKDVL